MKIKEKAKTLTVTVTLKKDIARWIEGLSIKANLPASITIEKILQIMYLATSTEEGKKFIGMALRAAGG